MISRVVPVGTQFGHLTVLACYTQQKRGFTTVKVRCDCDHRTVETRRLLTIENILRQGKIPSCLKCVGVCDGKQLRKIHGSRDRSLEVLFNCQFYKACLNAAVKGHRGSVPCAGCANYVACEHKFG